MNDMEENPSPKTLDKKIEQEVFDNYEKFVKEQTEVENKKLQDDAAQKFDSVRQLGFVTKKDLDETIQRSVKNVLGQFVTEVENLKKENTALRELIYRAKARGQLDSGVMDEQPKKEESSLKAWERPFMEEFEVKKRRR